MGHLVPKGAPWGKWATRESTQVRGGVGYICVGDVLGYYYVSRVGNGSSMGDVGHMCWWCGLQVCW